MVLALVGVASAATNSAAASVSSHRYIVVLRGGTNDPGVIANEHGRRYGVTPNFVYRHALDGYAATVPDATVAALRMDPAVAYVSPDAAAIPSGSTQVVPTGIRRVNGDVSSARSGDGRGAVNSDVAVIDSGIDLANPDLNVVGGVNCSSGQGFADEMGHGTGVAGVLAARDDASGVVGMAPGARLWAVRVFNKGGRANDSNLLCGFDWVTAHSDVIHVANYSGGGPGTDDHNCGLTIGDPIHQSVCAMVRAGVTLVVSAGNDSEDASNTIPASYDEVITVSALADFDGVPGGLTPPTCGPKTFAHTTDDTFVFFSNYGADVDLIAPGACITTTAPGGGLQVEAGTSFSSPHVAGAAVLYKVSHPGTTPAQVRAALIASGNFNYTNSLDPDGTMEPLLDASKL